MSISTILIILIYVATVKLSDSNYGLQVNAINLTSTFRGSGFPAMKRSRSKAVIV